MNDLAETVQDAAGVDAGGYEQSTPSPDLEKRLSDRLFDVNRKIVKPEPVYCVSSIGISTSGNLTVISAGIKAGKTAFVSAMQAAAMSQDPQGRDFLGVTSSNPKGHAMIHIDTEQSVYDHHAIGLQTLQRAGIEAPPPWYLSYCLTGFSVSDKKFALQILAENARDKFGGIHSIFLDGVADMAEDVNDSEESNALVAFLHALAIEFDCPIIAIIHVNPTGDKTRGHLGSQLERKAETNLRLEKKGEIICCWSDKNRRAPVPKDKGPRFVWSEEAGMHVSTESMGVCNAAKDRKKHFLMAEAVFLRAGQDSLSWTEFLDHLSNPEKLSKPGARKRMAKMKKLGVITKEPTGDWVLAR